MDKENAMLLEMAKHLKYPKKVHGRISSPYFPVWMGKEEEKRVNEVDMMQSMRNFVEKAPDLVRSMSKSQNNNPKYTPKRKKSKK